MSFKSGGVGTHLYTTTVSWVSGTWYHIAYIYDNDTGNLAVYVNGIQEDIGEAVTALGNGTGTNFVWNTNWTAIGTELDGDYEMDELAVSDVNRFADPWTPLTYSPDANISGIGGYANNEAYKIFSYIVDQNLSIDFNVFDADSAELLLDLNYSTEAGQGSGTQIINDLNLTTDQCDTTNWTVGAVHCSIDLNLIGIPDGNYYIKGELAESDLANTPDFFVSPAAAGIDNTGPTVSSHYPTGSIGVTGSSVVFLVTAADISMPGKVYAGFYLNGVLDHNTSEDTNITGTASFTYPFLSNLNDRVYLVVNTTEDRLGNTTEQAYATSYFIRTQLFVADLENITNEALEKQAGSLLYSAFTKLGLAVPVIVLLLLALMVFMAIIRRFT